MSKNTLKILLVMPRLIQNPGDGYSFPLGIAYISSSLKKAGYAVYTLNLNHRVGEVDDIIRDEMEANSINVVATGGLSFQYNTVRRVVESAKRINPKAVTIVGGGIITGDPLPAMEALEVADYGVIGEGEVTITELCHVIETGRDLSAVKGIIYKSDDGFVATNPRKEIANIDTIPWPDYEGFGIDDYLRSTPPGISGLNGRNTIFMLASRSCPFNCTFCFHTIGKHYRQRSLDGFFEELDHQISRHKIEYICLADELFTRDLQRVKDFCDRMKTYKIKWWAQFRVDKMTPTLLDILKEGGCDVMSFGLESADNRILKSMRKGTTKEQIERTLKMVYDSGISMEGAFIFGDVEETFETANNTLKWWREHSKYKINLNLITVYPGSLLYQYAIENGIITDRVQFLKDGCPQINVSKLTDGELSTLAKIIMDAPMSQAKTPGSIRVSIIDHQAGRVDVLAECVTCGQENRWGDVKLFATNFLSCEQCGQKYNIPLSSELRTNIETNIRRLLDKYGKVAIWGINYHTVDLFKYSSALQDENVYPIDISETKRKMDLHGRKILPPETIDKEGIKAVVISIPAFFTQIASHIDTDHKGVMSVVDICRLTNPEYCA